MVLPLQPPQPRRRPGQLPDPARRRMRHDHLRPAHSRRYAGRRQPNPPPSRGSCRACVSWIGISFVLSPKTWDFLLLPYVSKSRSKLDKYDVAKKLVRRGCFLPDSPNRQVQDIATTLRRIQLVGSSAGISHPLLVIIFALSVEGSGTFRTDCVQKSAAGLIRTGWRQTAAAATLQHSVDIEDVTAWSTTGYVV
jgi:hypothetical protein